MLLALFNSPTGMLHYPKADLFTSRFVRTISRILRLLYDCTHAALEIRLFIYRSYVIFSTRCKYARGPFSAVFEFFCEQYGELRS